MLNYGGLFKLVLKTKCHHKRLKVVLDRGRDLQICLDCERIVRSYKVNESLPGYNRKAITEDRMIFNDIFWGGSYKIPIRKGRVEE